MAVAEYFAYNSANLVGEHWVNESGDLMTGNLNMTDNRVQDYKGFPKPDYDSGWIALSPGASTTLTHGLYGDPLNYAVVLDFNNTANNTIHNQGIGGARYTTTALIGAYYYGLNSSHVSLRREANDQNADGIRVRIWKYT